jgi:hypothetical protein
MQVTRKMETTVTLVLTEVEARWLNAQVQNPLHNLLLEQEDPLDTQMRSVFFHATKLAQ